MAENNLIHIDGSYLEGGGQILRNAATLSCLLGIPVKVDKIRAGRSNPGLRPQHLTGLELIRDICHAYLEGGNVGSTEVTLVPREIRAGSHNADTHTAGSICLLLQAALPCILYAPGPSELHLKGGTNAEMAPQIDYLTWVFKPIAERFGLHFNCDILRRGYFPKGGGEVRVTANPVKSLTAVDLTDAGEVTKITGRAFVAGVLPPKVAYQMAKSAETVLKRQFRHIPIEIEAIKEPQEKAVGTGTGIILMAETTTECRFAGSGLGKKGVRAEKVGEDAANELLANLHHGGCVDQHLQDQLIILMALAKGKSQVKCGPLTQHTQTAINTAEKITKVHFEVTDLKKGLHLIQCEGIGLENKQFQAS